jgi:hypothetical protein
LTKSQIQEKIKQTELKREAKWLKMLDEWKHRHPEKLPKRIWKGIPNKFRLIVSFHPSFLYIFVLNNGMELIYSFLFKVWMKMLGANELKANARENLYQELLMRARLVSKDIKQIDLDINRTYRDHVSFRRRYDIK